MYTSLFQANSVKLGGYGVFVENAGTVLALRVDSVGKLVLRQWCFGGTRMGSNKCFYYCS